MRLIPFSVFFSLVAIMVAYGDTQSDLYSSNHEPQPPAPFPTAYKDYQILPGTISPNQQYALIYPKRSRLYELHNYGLFLAALKPFRILSRPPLGNSNLAENARCYFESNWANDSSAVVMIAGGRWGPERVSIVALHDGKVVKQSELTSEVRRLVQTDFQKSHANPYNDYYNFVMEQGYTSNGKLVDVPKDSTQQGWDLDGDGHVHVDCVCTTDPKNIEPHSWTVHFTGVWDIKAGHFQQKTFERVPFTPSLL